MDGFEHIHFRFPVVKDTIVEFRVVGLIECYNVALLPQPVLKMSELRVRVLRANRCC